MGKNRVIKTFRSDDTWVCPAGVTQVVVKAITALNQQTSTGSGHTSAGLDYLGTMYAWGLGTSGQLGDGTVISKSIPTAVLESRTWLQVATGNLSTYGVDGNGAAYAWGSNVHGQLGTNDVTDRSSPVAVVGGNGAWRELAPGNGFLGTAFDGTAYACGSNTNGQLGTGNVTDRSTPTAVLGSHKFTRISSAGASSIGLVGTQAFAWGLNANGQLGLGDVIPRSSPVLVVGGYSWKWLSIGGTGVTNDSGCGITAAGDAYAWGDNSSGQLGVGDVVARSSPVLVSGGLKWRRIYSAGLYMLGITTTGGAYAWGKNGDGQLGVGDIISRSTPTLVLGGQLWRSIYGNGSSSVIGLSATGITYAWGLNSSGQLGLNDTASRSQPVGVVGPVALWRAIDVNQVNALSVTDVIPGVSYPVTVFAKTATLGVQALYTDGVGAHPVNITLEYFA